MLKHIIPALFIALFAIVPAAEAKESPLTIDGASASLSGLGGMRALSPRPRFRRF